MTIRRTNRRSCRHRGGILFEVVLAIALFIAAAAFTLSTSRSVLLSLESSGKRLYAADLARSTMAELEVGLVTIADLRGGSEDTAVGSLADDEPISFGATDDPTAITWIIEAVARRSDYPGLSLVEVTVREDTGIGAMDFDTEDTGVWFTLRQLMPLSEADAEAYEEDEILEGLPEDPMPVDDEDDDGGFGS